MNTDDGKSSEENLKLWHVYIHTTPNKKHYVGITKKRPEERWLKGNGYKKQSYFYRAIQKYGWEHIRHDVVANGLTADKAKELEIKLISILRSNDKRYGYNITRGGDGTAGRKISDDEKQWLRWFMTVDNPFKGKKHTEETKRKMRENHKDCLGENNSFYGHKHTEETKARLSALRKGKYCGVDNPNYGRKDTPEQIQRKRELKSKPVDMFDLDGNFIRSYPSSLAAEQELGFSHSLITRVCRGKASHTHGYKWKYRENAV